MMVVTSEDGIVEKGVPWWRRSGGVMVTKEVEEWWYWQ